MTIVGIDLGNTNSLVSVWKDGECVVIPNNFQEYQTPSVVGIDENREILVGKTAKERLITHPKKTKTGFKRFMGTKKTFNIGMKRITSADAAAYILRQLKEQAEHYLKKPVEGAVISVPVYFNDVQRSAVRMAGRLAGLKVERILNEPSAAALAYCAENQKMEQTFMIIDMGGGTTDVSVLEVFDHVIEVLAAAGDNRLGGDGVDILIAERFLGINHLDRLSLTDEEWASVLKSAEQLKRKLSDTEKMRMKSVIRGRTYYMNLNRNELEEIAGPIIKSIEIPIRRALFEAHCTWEDIDEVLLVGGSCQMPAVQKYIRQLCGRDPVCSTKPETAVVTGCGMCAGWRMCTEHNSEEFLLTDLCPFTLGTDVANESEQEIVMDPVIKRNSVLPVSRVKRYYVKETYGRECIIRILQGENKSAFENITLGVVKVDLPEIDEEPEAVDIRFTYDIDGILEVDVTVISTQQTFREVFIDKCVDISEEELEEKCKELEEMKYYSQDQEEIRFLRARAERIYEESTGGIRKFIGEIIVQFENLLIEQDKKQIEGACQQLEMILNSIEESSKAMTGDMFQAYVESEWRKDSEELF